MRRGTYTLLFFIILLALGAAFVVFWPNVGKNEKPLYGINNPFILKQGLDLQGGISALLQPAPGQNPTADQMNQARTQIEQRVNGGLGVSEPVVRVQKDPSGLFSIDVELPGLNTGNQQAVINTLLKTGKLEFWDTGTTQVPDGTTLNPAQYVQSNNNSTQPLFTGADLDPSSLQVGQDTTNGTGRYIIQFAMKGSAVGRFSTFTANHIGNDLTVTLDRQVLTSAGIQSQISGQGQITGQFTLDQANNIVTDLKYGALPVPLVPASTQTVGPTLGQSSINSSLLAGAVGLGIVMLFMLVYYRLPGLLADIALVLYTGIVFAIFKLLGVTMSLAGIAGFILSIGMAVDANVLIFERVKEELRAGRLLSSAIDIGWRRAWPSIRDSNCSTMITCAVLYFFGSNFGATIIVGFATTLFLGVVISMFTAIVVTRTFLNLLVPTGAISHPALFGLSASEMSSSSSPTSTASVARRNS